MEGVEGVDGMDWGWTWGGLDWMDGLVVGMDGWNGAMFLCGGGWICDIGHVVRYISVELPEKKKRGRGLIEDCR